MSDSDSGPASSNRRSGDRYLACTMASLERPDGEQRPALVHDLSESGALLLVRTTKITVDDEVGLHLQAVQTGDGTRVAQGVVVRVEELSPGDAGPWMRRVAVRFREPLRMVASEIEGFRQRAQRLGISG
jgi:hypothetical protein